MTTSRPKPSPKFLAAVAALQDLVDAEGLDAVTRAYSTVTQDAAKQAFIEKEGGPARSRRMDQPYHLLRRNSGNGPCCFSIERRAVWTKEKGRTRAVLTAEPFALDAEGLRKLVDLHDRWNLDVRVSAASFSFPGQNLLVTIRPPEKR